jgi:hypothetical protein
MSRLVYRSLLVFAFLVASHLGMARSSNAQNGMLLGGPPLLLDHAVTPGQVIEGQLQLINTADEPLDVRVYLQDVRQEGGEEAYFDPGTTERSVGAWVALSRSAVTVPANATVAVPYQITVPRDSLRGTYWGMVMVQPDHAVERTVSVPAKNGGTREVTLRQVFRLAKYLAVTVSDEPPALALTGAQLEEGEDAPVLRVELHNGGDSMASPDVWVEVYDEGGESYGTHTGSRALVFPGGTRRSDVVIRGVPAGAYQAVLFVDDHREVVGTRLRLTL